MGRRTGHGSLLIRLVFILVGILGILLSYNACSSDSCWMTTYQLIRKETSTKTNGVEDASTMENENGNKQTYDNDFNNPHSSGQYPRLDNNHDLYYNLSCPLELHRYSCVFQGKIDKAKASRDLVEEQWNHIRDRLLLLAQPQDQHASTQSVLLQPRSRFVLLGDSLVRQVFVSLGCLLHASGLLVDYWINWPAKNLSSRNSPCDTSATNTSTVYQCIEHGEHSRFTEGVLFVATKSHERQDWAEIHYQSVNHGAMALEFLQQLSEAQTLSLMTEKFPLTWDLPQPPSMPGSAVYYHDLKKLPRQTMSLTDQDIVLLSVGAHDTGDVNSSQTTEQVYESLFALGQQVAQIQRHSDSPGTNLISTDNEQEVALPSLWFMTTPTQHFTTLNGMYDRNNTSEELGNNSTRRCHTTADANLRRDAELSFIAGSNGYEHVIDYGNMDLALGDYHLDLLPNGKHDCTHYCMPGPPDLAALSIVESLLDRNEQQQVPSRRSLRKSDEKTDKSDTDTDLPPTF